MHSNDLFAHKPALLPIDEAAVVPQMLALIRSAVVLAK